MSNARKRQNVWTTVKWEPCNTALSVWLQSAMWHPGNKLGLPYFIMQQDAGLIQARVCFLFGHGHVPTAQLQEVWAWCDVPLIFKEKSCNEKLQLWHSVIPPRTHYKMHINMEALTDSCQHLRALILVIILCLWLC